MVAYMFLINSISDKLHHIYMDGTVHSDVKKLEHLFDEILEKNS